MKKFFLILFLIFFTIQSGDCTSFDNNINVLNLKSNNVYLLDMDSKVKSITVSDKNIVNVSYDSSIYSNKKQLLIEANNNGICDVVLSTEDNDYKIRFISGTIFEDETSQLTPIDIPPIFEGKIK